VQVLQALPARVCFVDHRFGHILAFPKLTIANPDGLFKNMLSCFR
jgi:hypothetical protein